jgi:hypothetical protein
MNDAMNDAIIAFAQAATRADRATVERLLALPELVAAYDRALINHARGGALWHVAFVVETAALRRLHGPKRRLLLRLSLKIRDRARDACNGTNA